MPIEPMSLVDVLSPPANPWLAGMRKNPEDLPLGVKVVRFGNDDDEEEADIQTTR